MFFKKEFVVTREEGLKLINEDDAIRYIADKVEHFTKAQNYLNKEEKLKLLGEIVEMCYHDEIDATFDYSHYPNMQGTNLSDMKSKMIYWYNIAHILGGICLNTFNAEENRIENVKDGISGPINTKEMFLNAYDELISRMGERKSAYGATLILATLFEKDLKEQTKIFFATRYLNILKSKVDIGEVSLTPDENNLFDFLQYHYNMISQRTTIAFFDSVKATCDMQYSLLRKYNIITEDKEIEKLICNKFTLNPFIHSELFNEITDTRFYQLVDILFDTRKLNLRNNLAHCNFTYMDYYSIHITALLFVLFTMVSDKSFLKETEA